MKLIKGFVFFKNFNLSIAILVKISSFKRGTSEGCEFKVIVFFPGFLNTKITIKHSKYICCSNVSYKPF